MAAISQVRPYVAWAGEGMRAYHKACLILWHYSLRKDLVFNSWLDRIFSPVRVCSDTPSTDNLPYLQHVCVGVLGKLWHCSHSEAQTCTHFHTLGGWTCGIPSHLAPGLLTHCDWTIIRSDGLSIRIKPWLIFMSQLEKDHTLLCVFISMMIVPCVLSFFLSWDVRGEIVTACCLSQDFDDIYLVRFFLTQAIFPLLFSLPDWLLSWADWLADSVSHWSLRIGSLIQSESFSEAEWEAEARAPRGSAKRDICEIFSLHLVSWEIRSE